MFQMISGMNEACYKYSNLLDRVKKNLIYENEGFNQAYRLIIKSPKMIKDGSKKTIFLNFEETWKKLDREKLHLISFISAEMGTFVSLQDGGALVLKGRFQQRGMENVLRSYIKEFVLCETCGSAKTTLEKNSENRLHFITCKYCGASRSVLPVKHGYMAQMKRRKK
jgi:translation initiation factor 2 subunit 2